MENLAVRKQRNITKILELLPLIGLKVSFVVVEKYSLKYISSWRKHTVDNDILHFVQLPIKVNRYDTQAKSSLVNLVDPVRNWARNNPCNEKVGKCSGKM